MTLFILSEIVLFSFKVIYLKRFLNKLYFRITFSIPVLLKYFHNKIFFVYSYNGKKNFQINLQLALNLMGKMKYDYYYFVDKFRWSNPYSDSTAEGWSDETRPATATATADAEPTAGEYSYAAGKHDLTTGKSTFFQFRCNLQYLGIQWYS